MRTKVRRVAAVCVSAFLAVSGFAAPAPGAPDAASPSGPIPVVVEKDLADAYRVLVRRGPPSAVVEFLGLRRDLVELVLLAQAFEKAGLLGRLVFEDANSDRGSRLVASGQAFMHGAFLWLDDLGALEGKVSDGIAMLPSGSNVWGVYGPEDNPRLRSAARAEDLRGLVALTDPSWTRDVRVLERLGAVIEPVKVWDNLKRMLAAGRADFTLLPFAPGDMVLEWYGTRIAPVRGLKVLVPGERGFATSLAFPDADRIRPPLEAALRAMAADGAVTRAFRRAGFIDDPRVEGWTAIAVD